MTFRTNKMYETNARLPTGADTNTIKKNSVTLSFFSTKRVAVSVSSVQNTEDTKLEIALKKRRKLTDGNEGCA